MQLKVTLLRRKSADSYARITDFKVGQDEENFTRAVALEAKRHGGTLVQAHPRQAIVNLDEKTSLYIAALTGKTCGTCGVEHNNYNGWCPECIGRRNERESRARAVEVAISDDALDAALAAL